MRAVRLVQHSELHAEPLLEPLPCSGVERGGYSVSGAGAAKNEPRPLVRGAEIDRMEDKLDRVTELAEAR